MPIASRSLDAHDSIFICGLRNIYRRLSWITDNLSLEKATNFSTAFLSWISKSEQSSRMPPILKIDISPLCNLRCTICVHAKPDGNPLLEFQDFNPKQKMSLKRYKRIMNEVQGCSSVASLYYLGDPLMHPNLNDIAHCSREAGLNVHISTNFSFNLSEWQINNLVHSGITHFRVCLDGWTQRNYSLTRVGGRVDLVKRNLKRLCELRKAADVKLPRIEVQFIKFRHNYNEMQKVLDFSNAIGVDDFVHFWGDEGNYTTHDPLKYSFLREKEPRLIPHCPWPYFVMLIKYNGDVIPCCNHRLAAQYSKFGGARVLGNVFKDGIENIWRSNAYQDARRLASGSNGSTTDGINHFCEGCSTIFQTA